MSKSTILIVADDELIKPLSLTLKDLPNFAVGIYQWLNSWCCVTEGNNGC